MTNHSSFINWPHSFYVPDDIRHALGPFATGCVKLLVQQGRPSSCTPGTSWRRITNHLGVVVVTPSQQWSIPRTYYWPYHRNGWADGKQKGNTSNGCWANCMVSTFHLTHDLDLGFSRSNFEIAVSQEWAVCGINVCLPSSSDKELIKSSQYPVGWLA